MPTLASCISATPGKSFIYTVNSTYNGIGGPYENFDVTITQGSGAKSYLTEETARTEMPFASDFPEEYLISYTATNLTLLASTPMASADLLLVDLGAIPSPDIYSGFIIDLTKKAGESQTINYTMRTGYQSPGATLSPIVLTMLFEGTETITLLNTSFNTCRVSSTLLNTDGSIEKSTAWYAAGFGYESPIRKISSTTNATGVVTATKDISLSKLGL